MHNLPAIPGCFPDSRSDWHRRSQRGVGRLLDAMHLGKTAVQAKDSLARGSCRALLFDLRRLG